MHRSIPAALLLLASLNLACVRQGGAERPILVGGGAVVVVFSQAPEELPFNPRGARLLAATQQLEAIVAHPVEIQLDAALLPQWAQNFENGLAGGIENATRDLAWMKLAHPRIFAFAKARLLRIQCHYDASARFYSSTFDDRAGTLTISGPVTPAATSSVQEGGPAVALIEAGALRFAIPEAYVTDYLERLFAGIEPESAPLADLDRYWDYIERVQSGYLRRRPAAPKTAFADDPHALLLLRAVRLAPRVPADNTMLTRAIRKALLEGADFFGRAYVHQPEATQQASSDSIFRQAERAWVRWFSQSLDGLSEEEQRAMGRSVLFHPATGRARHGHPGGIDVLGLGLLVVDRWIAAGHPASPAALEHQPLFAHVVCPRQRDEDGRPTTPSGCRNGLYAQALESVEGRNGLFTAITQRRDLAFTETVFANLAFGAQGARANLLELWRGIESHPTDFSAATRVLAEAAMAGAGGAEQFYDEGLRLWRSRPDYRGEALYLLAGLEPYNLTRVGLVNWPEFDRIFGSPIDASAYTAYLRQGPLALSNVAGLWLALGPGFSRIAPLLPLLDAYIDDPGIKVFNRYSPEQPLKDIASRLCADHAEADLALYNAYFRKRAALRPSEERRFGLLLDITSPGRCVATAKPGGRR